MIRLIRRSSVVVTKRILEFQITTAVLCHGLHNFIMGWKGGRGDRSTQFEPAVVTRTRHDFTTHRLTPALALLSERSHAGH